MIPDFQTCMRPVLAFLSNGEVHRTRDIRESLANEFELSEAERAELLPSGRQRTFDNRVGWAVTYLAQAGLIERPARGTARITATGRQALADNPERVDMRVLEQYPDYLDFRDRTRNQPAPAAPSDNTPDTATQQPVLPAADQTPTELLSVAERTNRAAVEGEILRAAMSLSPAGFEALVIRLLAAMGYGRLGSVEGTSISGDAGIDGIISQDPLGLDRIYVQAKRYAEDHPIDRPRIHEFAGALLGKQGDRGVYITTSRFTAGAQQEAERINARIELIDGARLAELLVQYGVGVQPEQTAVLYRLDEDFFDTL